MTDSTHTRSRLIDAIASWDPLDDELVWSDARFDELAKKVFAVQFEQNAPFRSFCEGRDIDPSTVQTYRDIPAVPTDVFKHVRLSRATHSSHTFRTSGTTRDKRGEHHFESVDVYRASLRGPFRRFCMPDRREIRILIAAPPAEDLPDSSLSFMLSELFEAHADDQSAFFVEHSGEQLELRLRDMANEISRAQREDIPVFLLGTAFAFAELFETVDTVWALPPGSRVMETGGFKGKKRQMTRDQLYTAFEDRLGIPETMCVGEYSMTELSSQAYTNDLVRHLRHTRHPQTQELDGDLERRSELHTPPWVRIELVDPRTLEPIEEDDAQGLICWYDLANIDSVVAVQTTDVGRRAHDGFQLLGRAPDADLRGCSLTIEEIVEGS